MDLNIVIVLLVTFIARGHSLSCFVCDGAAGVCKGVWTECPYTATTCVSSKSMVQVKFTGATKTMLFKKCDVRHNCVSGSVNYGFARTVVSMQCCNTDMCNSRDIPDYSSNRPNGKQCYYCDGKSCFNKLNCSGTEDSCITAKALATLSGTVKGCASKSLCDAASQSQVLQGFMEISCCQGNLCNGAMIVTQNLLFLLWPLFFYILIH